MQQDNMFESINEGITIKSETQEHTFYTTINVDSNGKIVEIFVRLDDPELFEMIQLVTRLSSVLLKNGHDPLELAKELQSVYSPITKHIIPGTMIMCPSIIARIGMILEEYIIKIKDELWNGTSIGESTTIGYIQ